MPNMTTAELQAFEARRHRPAPGSDPGVRAGAEHELHAAIVDECRRRGWISLHGSMSRRTHRNSGEPDFIILADHGRQLHVECKTKAGKLSAAQNGMAAHYRKLGHNYHVIRSLAEFLELTR